MSYPLINGAEINGDDDEGITESLTAIAIADGMLAIGFVPSSLVAISIPDQEVVFPQKSFAPVSLVAIGIPYQVLRVGLQPSGQVFFPESLAAISIPAQAISAHLTLATPDSLTAVAINSHSLRIRFPSTTALEAMEIGDGGTAMTMRPASLLAIDIPAQRVTFAFSALSSLEAISIGALSVRIGGVAAGDSDALVAMEIGDGGQARYGFRPRSLFAMQISDQQISRATTC